MNKGRFTLSLVALLLLVCTAYQAFSEELPTLSEKKGLIFGRLVPLIGIKNGIAKLDSTDGWNKKVSIDANGFFVYIGKPGLIRLLQFSYRNEQGEYTIIPDKPVELMVVADQASYIGQIIISPYDGQVRLTDDFIRDRNWFFERFGRSITPASIFNNHSFYKLMETYSKIDLPKPQLAAQKASIPQSRFLMGDVWPGFLLQGPGGVDLTQIPPREVEVQAFLIDTQPYVKSDSSQSPMVNVTWAEADAVCRERDGRLPTEAEYELAARGPRWNEHLYAGAPQPGGSVLAASFSTDNEAGWTQSPFGVRFQAAGLAEWTADRYQPASESRIVRAGPYRFAASPASGYPTVGFRCVYKPLAE